MQRSLTITLGLLFLSSLVVSIKGQSNRSTNAQFIENKGQWQDNIRFRLRLSMADIYFEDNLFTVSLYDPVYFDKLHEASHGGENAEQVKAPLNRYAYKMEFLNANPQASSFGLSKNSNYFNYFLGNDESKWAGKVSSYQGVQYNQIYPGIDIKVYGIGDRLKYDYIIHQGASPNQIQVKYVGADDVYLKNGDLHVQNPVNGVTELRPFAYQMVNGQRNEVACAYKLNGNIVSYVFPDGYDVNKELVIDPELIFSTYSGSLADNWGYTATYDDSGHLYSAGLAFGVGYPLTNGSFQTGFAGGPGQWANDIALTKYTPDGSALVYSTYLGGNNTEIPLSLIVNSADELYVYGATSSSNFPVTTGAYDTFFGGGTSANVTHVIDFTNGSDIFVSKFSAAGNALIGSTFLGGSANDGLNLSTQLGYNYGDHARGEIILDASSNCYVASSTFSTNFPTTPGAYQPNYVAGQEGCVFKLNPNLTSLVWSTYLGGSADDAAYSIKHDAAGNIFVSGGTTSSNLLPGSTGLNPSQIGGVDGYIAKFSADGSSILASTYLGTTSYDQAYFVEVDDNNDIYTYGQSAGAYNITPPGVYSNAGGKQFIHKLDNNLNSTFFSTVFGSGGTEVNISPTALLVDICGRIYVSGWGGKIDPQNFPNQGFNYGMAVSPDAFQPTTDGSDFYFMVLEKDADSLLYATYFGGNSVGEHCDGGTSRFDKNGIIYQAVCAGCGGTNLFPTTQGAWSNTNNSDNCNLGSIKFQIQLIGVDVEVSVDGVGYVGCLPMAVNLNANSENSQNWFWDFGDGSTSTEENPNHIFDSAGVFTVIVIGYDSLTCNGLYFSDTASAEFTVVENQLVSDAGADVSICLGDTITLGGDSSNAPIYQWTPNIYLSSDTGANPQAAPQNTITYYLTVTDNICTSNVDSIKVSVITDVPSASFDSEYFVDCKGSILRILNSSTNSDDYYWDFGDGNTSTEENPEYVYGASHGLKVTLVVTNASGCTDTLQIDDSNLILLDSSSAIVPNVFTPNGDGKNDFFITNLLPELEGCFEMVIYNRWGRKVFETDTPLKLWDGKIEGKTEVEEGVYYYIVKIKDEEFAGFVELFR